MKKIYKFLALFALIFLTASSSHALLKGLESENESVLKVGGNIEIPVGVEVKSAVAIGGSVTVYGRVAEDVVAIGGSVYLKETAIVDGNAVSIGGKIDTSPGAVVRGDLSTIAFPGEVSISGLFSRSGILRGLAFFNFLSFLGFLVLTVILVALFTPHLGKISAAVEKQGWRNFLVGLIVMLLFIPVIVMLAVSIMGIVLIPIWMILVIAGAIIGYIGVSHYIGKRILYLLKVVGKPMVVETLLGVIVLYVVGFIPFLGFLIKCLVGCCGLGGVALTRFGTVRS